MNRFTTFFQRKKTPPHEPSLSHSMSSSKSKSSSRTHVGCATRIREQVYKKTKNIHPLTTTPEDILRDVILSYGILDSSLSRTIAYIHSIVERENQELDDILLLARQKQIGKDMSPLTPDALEAVGMMEVILENVVKHNPLLSTQTEEDQIDMVREWFDMLHIRLPRDMRYLHYIYASLLLRQEFPVLVKYPSIVREMTNEILQP